MEMRGAGKGGCMGGCMEMCGAGMMGRSASNSNVPPHPRNQRANLLESSVSLRPNDIETIIIRRL